MREEQDDKIGSEMYASGGDIDVQLLNAMARERDIPNLLVRFADEAQREYEGDHGADLGYDDTVANVQERVARASGHEHSRPFRND